MNNGVIITCAVTGSGDSHLKHPGVPRTPEEIAKAAIEAAKAGAAVAHVHVRNPETGDSARDIELYKETAKLIRESEVDVILNITAGMGADFVPDEEDPSRGGPGTDMITAAERVRHIELIKPEICTLDCGSMNYATTSYIATMDMLRETARRIQASGVKPEIEVFELGHVWQAKQLMKEGLIDPDPIFQLCMGVPYGAEATVQNMVAMVNALPPGANWGSFALGRMQMPWVAQSVLLGGNVRVGLEDNIYLDKGVLATNEQLVTRAKELIERMGAKVLTPAEARDKIKLVK
ncbi:BKACE family enzyme [Anaeromicrobium sediminis]|uniref:NADPH:quinone reductase n=1 Tax=Anaeromicrobium sediminis TaxID=1478221 RepID=A0A267MK07_9FIRM|nr:3-keto-5-aminohexanoate cleavage protein [Anaeromicrobium sediminis]PAB59120.1 NADPH:quinone reductase [Anaeromicrobium sediminis]